MTRTDKIRNQIDFTYYGDNTDSEFRFMQALIKAADRLGKKYHINVSHGEDTFKEETYT